MQSWILPLCCWHVYQNQIWRGVTSQVRKLAAVADLWTWHGRLGTITWHHQHPAQLYAGISQSPARELDTASSWQKNICWRGMIIIQHSLAPCQSLLQVRIDKKCNQRFPHFDAKNNNFVFVCFKSDIILK